MFFKEEKKGVAVDEKMNVMPVEEKTLDDEPIVYATKQVSHFKLPFQLYLQLDMDCWI